MKKIIIMLLFLAIHNSFARFPFTDKAINAHDKNLKRYCSQPGSFECKNAIHFFRAYLKDITSNSDRYSDTAMEKTEKKIDLYAKKYNRLSPFGKRL